MADQRELLALHSYVLDAANSLAEAEKRLLIALGQAATLADDDRGAAARALLTEQIAMLREAAGALSDWLDSPDVSREG
jgi:hypothetical protein